AAHGVMPSSKRTADNHRDLWHNRVRHGIYHFCASLDDPAPLRIAAHHEPVDVVEKYQLHQVLIAIHDESSRFFRRFGVNNTAKFHALMALVISALRMHFLIGDNADCETADPGISAHNRLAVLSFVLFELTG